MRRQGHHGGGFFTLPLFDQRPGFVAGIVFALLLVLGVLFWYLLFAWQTPDANKILYVGIGANVITLILTLAFVGRARYETFTQCFTLSYLINVALSVAGLYILNVQLIANPDGSQMIAFWRFALFMFIAALMTLAPTILLCAVLWLFLSIFG